ncbi:glycine cleavage T C-terminal barrel domain-containing protein [Sinomonas sp. ASV322]|uniref:CAF17-like 4Fe-4S cluster assembly/insertion protein YgfZ n=1 Tax=Sinomonas sp. ASV322 TaxID=3041920 RepID=UPI0027DABF2D|nr:glycine cleavage T C-terminal barrel domain-containing protein [Sinomonas sp. ASV322]MDQ4501781.1 glycine cleavage T C-terminal barrel domain-containing protein [Sinomonas sp. ASV322]
MSFTSPLLARPGAVAASGANAGAAAHYGDPLREQRALAEGRAVVDLSFRGVVTVTGPDRLTWLTTLSSQQVANLAPGESAELLLLSLQGRIEYDARIVDDGTTAWLLVEAGEAVGLTAWLDSMRFMLRVEVADVSDAWGVLAATRRLDEFAGLAGIGPVWQDPWPHVAPGGYSYATVAEDRHPGLERPWFEQLVRADELEVVADALDASGVGLAGSMASEALRIAAWRPRVGFETDDKTIPHELDLLRTAVHLSKGCYKGQETIARVHNLGHPPRRLVMLQLDGSAHTLPTAGSPVFLAGDGGAKAVGRVTSAALHYEMGPIALAVVKRSTDPSAALVVHGEAEGETYAAAQETIVAPDAGQVVDRPAGLLRGHP